MTHAQAQIRPLFPDLRLTAAEAGQGRPVLILHGGGVPGTVAGIGAHLARTMHTLTPTHPGWNGSERPDWLTGIDDLTRSGSRPLGQGLAENFTGAVRIEPLFSVQEPARAVGITITFEPRARTAWHIHPH